MYEIICKKTKPNNLMFLVDSLSNICKLAEEFVAPSNAHCKQKDTENN